MTLKIQITLLLFIISSFAAHLSFAQELRCQVTINSQQVEETNKEIYSTMQDQINEFMNNQVWTDDEFLNQERIECNIAITIDSRNINDFKGKIQISSTRPGYGTDYNSPMIQFYDENLVFKYIEFQQFTFNEGSSSNNLVSVLAFYAYLILGMDYDSFSELGGNPWFKKSENISNVNQGTGDDGWNPSSSTKNRYWLINQLMDPRYEGIRKANYVYHRKGLDVMAKDVEKGRKEIINALKLMEKVHQNRPNSLLMRTIVNTKSNELVQIFSQAPPSEKTEVLGIMQKIDIANYSNYEQGFR